MSLVILFFCLCVYMMTRNGNDIIAPTAQAAMPAITFSFLREAALSSPFPFFVVGCRV